MRISDWSSDVCSSDLALGRRHNKPRRMHEGPQLQQIESRQVRIAKPLPHQRSVEENHRRLRRAANRLPFRHGARLAVRVAQPDAAMTCMQRRKGSGKCHYFPLKADWERQGNISEQFARHSDAIKGMAY